MPKSYKFRSDLLAVFIIGTAAFVLENPEKAKVEDVAKNAGLECMVKSYEQIIKIKPKAKSDRLDQLVTARKNNVELASLFPCQLF